MEYLPAPKRGDNSEIKPPKHENTFTIRLRNRLGISGSVPSQWLSVYLVHQGKIIQDFPFELSELAEARQLDFEFDAIAQKIAKTCRESNLGVHVYLANAKRGDVDLRSLDSGVFLGRFFNVPTGIELDARSMVQLFLGRLSKLRETQPAVSGMLAQQEFEAIVRPLDPNLTLAPTLESLRRVSSLKNTATLAAASVTGRVVLDK
ncbi:MAG: hypothetical protein P8171_22380 [Candidatus Thiodiazotropha sp.]